MGKINVLDKQVAELIAAGEVIERPASIAKELLENAIDAGATAVTVEVRQGGIGYLRVTDNGSGILPEDVPTAFLRHATSKIRNADDLNFIGTLGFRGEALASIAAVSRLELTTKTRENQLGVTIRLEGGEQLELDEAGCPDGTTVVVRDLFYNVPARLKFLRRDASEANAVGGIVDKLALSHPEVSFKFINDRNVKLHTPGDGRLLSAIRAVFGDEFANALLPVDYGMDGISVKGYVSQASYSRSNRSMQHFFVNSRYVRSKVCIAALEDGYKNAIMVGKYPCCVLNVSLPVETVDVNVSPSKTEVRFYNDRSVFDAVYFGVKSTLSRDDILTKAAQPTPKTQVPNLLSGFQSEEAEQTNLSAGVEEKKDTYEPFSALPTKKLTVHDTQAKYVASPSAEAESTASDYQFIRPEALKMPEKKMKETGITFIPEEEPEEAAVPAPVNQKAHIEPITQKEELPSPVVSVPNIYVRLIGEAFKTYVLFEVEGSLFLLDKHAAHERILYEKLKKTISTEERQLLLKPAVVTVSPEEKQALFDHLATLEKMGFSYEDFGANTVILREVPLLLAEFDVADILLDVAQKLSENRREFMSSAYENLLHSMACRCAMKANDSTTPEEMIELLRQVYADGEIRHCPHGRPVAIELTKTEIEKRFGRIQ